MFFQNPELLLVCVSVLMLWKCAEQRSKYYLKKIRIEKNAAAGRPNGYWSGRPMEGIVNKLLVELQQGRNEIERQLYDAFHRLSADDFDYLHSLVAFLIKKRDTNIQHASSHSNGINSRKLSFVLLSNPSAISIDAIIVRVVSMHNFKNCARNTMLYTWC